MNQISYPDDLSDSEWAWVEPLLEEVTTPNMGRPIRHSKRSMLNAIFYLLRTGCSWRHLPHDFPPWKSVNSQFYRWRNNGVFEKLTVLFRELYREKLNRSAQPSAGILDSQTVKTTEKGGLKDMMQAKKSKGERGTS